ncbi:Accumulation-associated protein [Venturia nashicola]|nr:Accumulation-associated protein [Venturia nashicola]
MSTAYQYDDDNQAGYRPEAKQVDPRYQPRLHQENLYSPGPPSPATTNYTASSYTTASTQYTSSSQYTNSSPFTDRATVDNSVNRYGETPSPTPTTYFPRPSSQQSFRVPCPQTPTPQWLNYQRSQSFVNSPVSPCVASLPYPQTPIPQWPDNTSQGYASPPIASTNQNAPYLQMPVPQLRGASQSQTAGDLKSPPTDLFANYKRESITHPQPQRPGLPGHQFSVPYIAAPHDAVPHVMAASPGPAHSSRNSLAAPLLPPRPSSAPSSQREEWRAAASAQDTVHCDTPSYHKASLVSQLSEQKDPKSHLVARFLGNTMPGRVGRATVQSLQSTAKLPYHLSPWGDNNPVTLPNIRRREFVFAGLMHVGVETLAPSAVTVIEKTIQKAAEFTLEEAADLGINIWDGKDDQKVKRRVGLNTIEFRIAHKLIGEEANLVFHGEKKAVDKRSCAKGWFCPYLYCSGRSTDLERSKDFAFAELRGPGLAADALIAPTLLSAFVETATPIVYLCPWELTHPTYPRYRRMAMFVAGISPYRTATAWSQARIPNEARLCFHLFAHIPALVIPVVAEAPVLAWSPWTIAQMLVGRRGGGQVAETTYKLSRTLKHDEHLAYGDASFLEREDKESCYDEKNHSFELMNFLEAMVDASLMETDTRRLWKNAVGETVQAMLDAVLSVPDAIRATAVGYCELERAGFVMFRY